MMSSGRTVPGYRIGCVLWHVSGMLAGAGRSSVIGSNSPRIHSRYSKGHTMSEFDVNAGQEHFDLDHGHQDFGDQHDHLQNFDAFGNQHASELDEHFAQGHHVESDTPASHFEESDFTNADVHASE